MATDMLETIGTVREFTLNEDFELWFEQFKEYVSANNTPEGRSVSVFLTLMGLDGYKLLRNLCVPAKPKNKSLTKLVTLIKYHLKPKPNVISERFKFKQRKQNLGESISTFLATLKQLSLNCEFGDNLAHNLRDQLVWGLRSERIQRRLLSETSLSYERAVELSLSLEATEKEVGSLSQSTHKEAESSISFIARKKTKSTKKGDPVVCFCCCKPNHKISECRYKEYTCNLCNKKRHLAIRCYSSKKNEFGKKQVKNNDKKKGSNKSLLKVT